MDLAPEENPDLWVEAIARRAKMAKLEVMKGEALIALDVVRDTRRECIRDRRKLQEAACQGEEDRTNEEFANKNLEDVKTIPRALELIWNMVMEGLNEEHDAQSSMPGGGWKRKQKSGTPGWHAWLQAKESGWKRTYSQPEMGELRNRRRRRRNGRSSRQGGAIEGRTVLEIEGVPGKTGCVRRRSGRKWNSHPISRQKQRRMS